MLDDRFEVLSSKFILPNINNKEGKITYYSNKLRQTELTRELGFESLTSEIIILNEFGVSRKTPLFFCLLVADESLLFMEDFLG